MLEQYLGTFKLISMTRDGAKRQLTHCREIAEAAIVELDQIAGDDQYSGLDQQLAIALTYTFAHFIAELGRLDP